MQSVVGIYLVFQNQFHNVPRRATLVIKFLLYVIVTIICCNDELSWLFTNRLSATRHGLPTPVEEIAFAAPPKINYHSQNFRYGQTIFCRPKFSDFFDLCLH